MWTSRVEQVNLSGRVAGCSMMQAEQVIDAMREGRTELAIPLDLLRSGVTLVVMPTDRLTRSMVDPQDIVRSLEAKRVTLRATEQPIDTGTAAGKGFLDVLGVFAEFKPNR